MKKIGIFLLLFCLMGCVRVGTTTEESDTTEVEEAQTNIVNCTNEANQQYTFFAHDDEIYSMQEIFYMSYEEVGVSEDMNMDEMKTNINNKLSERYSDVPGLSVVADEIADGQVKIIVMIDFDVADNDQLVELGLLQEGEVQSQYVSLKKTRESYTSNGFACAVQ